MKISELRKKTGLSQSQFARKFHISVRTLQRWERGQNPTPEFVIFMIKTILDLKDKIKKLEGKDADCN